MFTFIASLLARFGNSTKWILAIIVACTISFGAGHFAAIKSVQIKAAQHAAVSAKDETALVKAESYRTIKAESNFADAVIATRDTARFNTDSLIPHLYVQAREKIYVDSSGNRTVPESKDGQKDSGSIPLIGNSVLDDRTIGVLNAARANIQYQAEPAGTAHAQGSPIATPPFVTGADFTANDLEVVRMYHELAAAHDGLVDLVSSQCYAPSTLQGQE